MEDEILEGGELPPDEAADTPAVESSDEPEQEVSEQLENIQEISATQLEGVALCLGQITELQNEQQKTTQVLAEILASQSEILSKLQPIAAPIPSQDSPLPIPQTQTAAPPIVETPQNDAVENLEQKTPQKKRRLI